MARVRLWATCGMSFTLHRQCLVVFPSGFSSTLRRARNCSVWNCLIRPTGLARTCSGWRKISGFTFLLWDQFKSSRDRSVNHIQHLKRDCSNRIWRQLQKRLYYIACSILSYLLFNRINHDCAFNLTSTMFWDFFYPSHYMYAGDKFPMESRIKLVSYPANLKIVTKCVTCHAWLHIHNVFSKGIQHKSMGKCYMKSERVQGHLPMGVKRVIALPSY